MRKNEKCRHVSHPVRYSSGNAESRKIYLRSLALKPFAFPEKKTSGWGTGIVASAIAMGLVAGTPAWATTAVNNSKSLLSLTSVSSLSGEIESSYLPIVALNSEVSNTIQPKREILIIDKGVSDYQGLIDSVSRDVEIVFIRPEEDGIAAITTYLERRLDLKGIHIVSHGAPGSLNLGNSVFNVDALEERRHELIKWSLALDPEGDVLLYGCDVAAGIEGIRFVNRLAHTLSAGISASDDPTGNPSLGGDWNLEYRHEAEVKSLFAPTVVKNFHTLLAPGQVIAGDGSGGGGGGGGGEYYGVGNVGGSGGNGGGDSDILTGTADDDIIFGDGSGGGGGGGGGGKYGQGSGGSGGAGGSGSDTISGGSGDDIIFGDGFDGFAGSTASNSYNGGAGGASGFGNITGGTGGHGSDKYGGGGTNGTTGFGGALGGTHNGKYSDGSPGQDGSTTVVTPLADTGGAIHADATSKISSGYFTGKTGGSGNDILDGGAGSDALFGMGGANTFAFESDDATSGSDVDTIHDWNAGTANQLFLQTGGIPLDSAQIAAILAAQTGAPGLDRTIVHADGLNQVTIVVKDINRDLVSTDFGIPNIAPALSGTFLTDGTVDDNATIAPFNSVTVSDDNSDNVSVSITYTAANGTISGTGLTGSAGNYTLTFIDAATATTRLQGLTFTPTANQVAVGNTLVTGFTLTPNDGLVDGSSDSTTQVTVTSVNDNPTFTGIPAINGTAAVGNTLSLTGIGTDDPDFGDSVTLIYQWQADGTDIPLANSSSYLLTTNEAHKDITCTITANDTNSGSAGPVTTAPVTVTNVLPALEGTFTTNGTVNDTTTIAPFSGVTVSDTDNDSINIAISFTAANGTLSGTGVSGGSGSYTMSAPDPATATSRLQALVFTPVPNQVGVGNSVITGFSLMPNDGFGDGPSDSTTQVTATSINDNPTFTGTPSINGSATVDNTLSLNGAGTSDPDVNDAVAVSYQWKADGVDISGANQEWYVLTSNEAHKTISCTVTASDLYGGTAGPVTTGGLVWANNSPTFYGTPSISGTAQVSNILSLDNTGTNDADGDTVTLSYQWQADGVDIGGATLASHTLTTDEAHTWITCIVSGDDGNGGTVGPVTTNAVFIANSAPTFTGTPTINGTPAVGSTLGLSDTETNDTDGDTVTLSYQWKADGVDIDGAISSTYTLTFAEAHAVITCVITASDGHGGIAGPVTTAGVSAGNSAPSFTGTPSITGVPRAGNTLGLYDTGTEDTDGDPVALSYQWHADGEDINAATSATYTPVRDDTLKKVSCTLSADDGKGGTATYTTEGIVIKKFPWQMFLPAMSSTKREKVE